MLSVGKIVGGGFRLIKDHPVAVLVWGLLYGAATIGLMFAMRPFFQAQQAMLAGGGDPTAAAAQMTSMMGTILLAEFGFFILFIVLFTATQRAVLRPEQGGFAFLRLGVDELKMFALAFVLFIIFYIGMIVFGIVIAIVIGALAVTAGPEAFGISMVVTLAVVLVAALWFQVRVSLMFPMTLLTGNIAIGEGWRLSRGHFWTLFLGYLVIGLIVVVMWTAVVYVAMRPYFEALSRMLNDPLAVEKTAQAQADMFASMSSPEAMIGWGLSALAGAIGLALYGGAIATAAKELTVDREGMAKTFA